MTAIDIGILIGITLIGIAELWIMYEVMLG